MVLLIDDERKLSLSGLVVSLALDVTSWLVAETHCLWNVRHVVWWTNGWRVHDIYSVFCYWLDRHVWRNDCSDLWSVINTVCLFFNLFYSVDLWIRLIVFLVPARVRSRNFIVFSGVLDVALLVGNIVVYPRSLLRACSWGGSRWGELWPGPADKAVFVVFIEESFVIFELGVYDGLELFLKDNELACSLP